MNWVQINIQVNEEFRYMKIHIFALRWIDEIRRSSQLRTTTSFSSVLSCEDLLISFLLSVYSAALVEVFLRFLQKEYRWDTTNIVRISHQLVKDDVTTVNLLAKCWSHVQHFFPGGMSRVIEKELRKRGMLARTSWFSMYNNIKS